MRKRPKDSLLLFLFYLNFVVYVGGGLYWRLIDQRKNANQSRFVANQYDDLIQKYAQRYGLDWRFVSSMIDAESSFQSDVVSSAGAIGLMQVLPEVAHAEGGINLVDPEENIRIGLKHFKRYFPVLQGETLEDTLKLNLAAYNGGIAHVYDAQKLASYLGMNPKKWVSLEKTFPLLEQTEFHPFVDYGYCQGTSVTVYVSKVFRNYQRYRQIHPDYPFMESKEL